MADIFSLRKGELAKAGVRSPLEVAPFSTGSAIGRLRAPGAVATQAPAECDGRDVCCWSGSLRRTSLVSRKARGPGPILRREVETFGWY